MLQRFRLDEGSRQLLTVAGLPLVDGVFATLLVSGSISGLSSIISFALTVFAGAGSLAVLFSQSESREDARRMIYNVTPYLVAGAVTVALIAPVFQQLFAVTRLQYVAGAALMLISLKLADIEFAGRIPTHWVLVPGMIISFQGFSSFSLSTVYLLPAVATVAAACLSMIGFSFFREVNLDLDIIRKGSALVLAIFSFSMFGTGIPGNMGLMIFGLSLVGSFISPRMNLQLPVYAYNLKKSVLVFR